jgi:hypothetical protein
MTSEVIGPRITSDKNTDRSTKDVLIINIMSIRAVNSQTESLSIAYLGLWLKYAYLQAS